jgi:hypothetical protein
MPPDISLLSPKKSFRITNLDRKLICVRIYSPQAQGDPVAGVPGFLRSLIQWSHELCDCSQPESEQVRSNDTLLTTTEVEQLQLECPRYSRPPVAAVAVHVGMADVVLRGQRITAGWKNGDSVLFFALLRDHDKV